MPLQRTNSKFSLLFIMLPDFSLHRKVRIQLEIRLGIRLGLVRQLSCLRVKLDVTGSILEDTLILFYLAWA